MSGTTVRAPLHDERSGLRFFRREPAGPARRLVVLLHGAGANGADLAGMEERYAARVPDAVWLRPDAPHSVEDGLAPHELESLRRARPGVDFEVRRNWADPSALSGVLPPGVDPEDTESVLRGLVPSTEEALRPSANAVNDLVDSELERLGLDDSALAVYGFSQGGLAALHTALSRAEPCAAAVAHSGQFFGLPELTSRPPVLLLFGEEEVTDGRPGKVLFPWAARVLEEAGVQVEQYEAKGLGHGSSRRSDVVICRFIECAFQARGR